MMRHPKNEVASIATLTNVHAERAVLGAILEVESYLNDALRAGLMAKDFSISDYRRIYMAMLLLVQANRPIDYISVAEVLGNSASDIALLSDLIVGVVLNRCHILHLVEIIIEKSKLRQIQELSELLQTAVNQPGAVASDVAPQFSTELAQIAQKRRRGAFAEPAAQKEKKCFEQRENTTD